MTKMKLLIGGAGLAAIAAAVPAVAQSDVGVASDRCVAAVQDRLNARSGSDARVLAVTKVNPHKNLVTVWGIATSGAFGRYGEGAYGALGYDYAKPADISFKCKVDYRGFVRDIDLDRNYKQ